MTAQPVEVTDASNLVTTATSTHLPEQKETMHMIQMLRQEACSGQTHDLAHVLTKYCLADPLTKKSVSPSLLISTVQTERETKQKEERKERKNERKERKKGQERK